MENKQESYRGRWWAPSPIYIYAHSIFRLTLLGTHIEVDVSQFFIVDRRPGIPNGESSRIASRIKSCPIPMRRFGCFF